MSSFRPVVLQMGWKVDKCMQLAGLGWMENGDSVPENVGLSLAVYLALGSSRLDRKIDIMQINYKAEKVAEKLSAGRSVWGALSGPVGRGYGIPHKCDHHSSKSLWSGVGGIKHIPHACSLRGQTNGRVLCRRPRSTIKLEGGDSELHISKKP